MRNERINLIPPAAVPSPNLPAPEPGRWPGQALGCAAGATARDAAALRFIGEHYTVTR